MGKSLYLKVNKLSNKTRGKFISSKTLYNGKFIKVISEIYKLPNNKIIEREKIEKNDNKESVIIISITEDNKFLLVFQNRVSKITSIEFPSGYVEENESVEEAAKRELLEETGYTSDDVVVFDSYHSQLGVDTSIVNIALAKNCIKTKKQNLGLSEYINFCEFSFEELCVLVKENYIKGCGNKLAFYELLNNYSSECLHKKCS